MSTKQHILADKDHQQNIDQELVQEDKKRDKFRAKKEHYLKCRMAEMKG